MPEYRIQFEGEPPDPPKQEAQYSARFGYVVTPLEMIGTPVESSSSTRAVVVAEITGSLLATWRDTLARADVPKVLFYLARQVAAESLQLSGKVTPVLRISLETYSQGKGCPYDARAIEQPPGDPVFVEVAKPIGF